MKGKLSNILLILVFFAGLSLLLYPSVSNYWNSLHTSRVVSSYSEEIRNMDREEYDEIWKNAAAYNQSLLQRQNPYILDDAQREVYRSQLNITGGGVMGQIEIPMIDCTLPIYHTTDEAVLQVGVGHIEWTSLPVGGESTHCALSGHTGLPSAQLFTKLNKLEIGDTFVMRILDEVLTYEVDKISIVNPDEVAGLLIEEGKDLCTLVTCTPYGLNTHRLLVRGHRIENTPEAKTIRIISDAIRIEPVIVAPIAALPMLLVLFILLFAKGKRKSRRAIKEQFLETIRLDDGMEAQDEEMISDNALGVLKEERDPTAQEDTTENSDDQSSGEGKEHGNEQDK